MKKLKAISLTFGLLLICTSLIAQVTFNKRMTFGFPASILGSIEVTDSCYYVSGGMVDTIDENQSAYFFAKLNLEGEIIASYKIAAADKSYRLNSNHLIKTSDGNFLNLGLTYDSLPKAIIIKHDPLCNIISAFEFLSPFAPENLFISPQGLVVNSSDTTLLMTANTFDEGNGASNVWYSKIDHSGIILWDSMFTGNINLHYGSTSLAKTEGGYVIGGAQSNDNLVSLNFTYQSYLFKIDEEGTVEWNYLSNEEELQFPVYDVLALDDGSYIMTSGKGTEHVSGMAAYISWQNYVFKIDANQEFEWGLNLRSGLPESTNYLHKMLEISNGTGYIIAGHNHEPNYDENGQDNYGTIIKISTSGDSLWTRRYQHLISPQDDHVFYDIEETTDGGFIMVGQSTEGLNAAPQPHQQSWIVKVDQHGCLVPGCHLIDDVEEPIVDLQLSLYPNPTSDYLNVFYYDPNHGGEMEYQITDIQGRILRQFKSRQNNVTLMIPLDGLVAGQYFLVVKGGGGMVTEGFVKL